MPLYRDEAVVLRVHKLGEADRIVTLLTRRHGRVRAVGKGVRRTSSQVRRAARTRQPHRRAALHPAARRAARRRRRSAGSTSSPRPSRSTPTARSWPTTTPRGRPCRRSARPPSGSPRRASRRCGCTCWSSARCARWPTREHDPGLVLDAFLIRAMSLCRLGTGAAECAKCSAPGPHAAFNVAGRRRGLRRLPPSRVGPAAAGDRRADGRAARRRLGARRRQRRRPRREASGLVAAHLQWHLERGLRSLPLVDRCDPPSYRFRRPVAARVFGRSRGATGPTRRRTRPVRSRRTSRRALVPAHVAIVMDGNGRWAHAARAAPHRGAPGRRGRADGRAATARCELGVSTDLGLRVLHRELAALARRGPLPDGLQQGRASGAAATSWPRSACGSAGPAAGRGCGAA